MMIVRADPRAITRMFGPGLEETDILLRHVRRGTSYNIVCIAIREADETPMMVYRDAESGDRWTRPVADFFSKDDAGNPKWTWNGKADKIMQMIRSALDSYYLGKKTSKSREGSSS